MFQLTQGLQKIWSPYDDPCHSFQGPSAAAVVKIAHVPAVVAVPAVAAVAVVDSSDNQQKVKCEALQK